jgi:hypothetical protein
MLSARDDLEKWPLAGASARACLPFGSEVCDIICCLPRLERSRRGKVPYLRQPRCNMRNSRLRAFLVVKAAGRTRDADGTHSPSITIGAPPPTISTPSR